MDIPILKERKKCCPECGYELLAREGNKIFCLRNGCEWFVEAKRKEDELVPDIHKLQNMWH